MNLLQLMTPALIVARASTVAATAATVGLFALDGLRTLAAQWPPADFESALVLACSAVLLGCLAWCAAVSTVVVLIGLVAWARGVERHRGLTGSRRWLLVACGLALTAPVVTTPASADDTAASDRSALAGLPFPDRATGGTAVAPTPSPAPPPAEDRQPSTTAPGPAPSDTERTPAGPTTPPPDLPSGPPATPATDPPTAPVGSRSAVLTVRPGDTLWDLGAGLLGPGASDRDIAVSWQRLYTANRDVIGADPGLILPGQRLAVPHEGPSADQEQP